MIDREGMPAPLACTKTTLKNVTSNKHNGCAGAAELTSDWPTLIGQLVRYPEFRRSEILLQLMSVRHDALYIAGDPTSSELPF